MRRVFFYRLAVMAGSTRAYVKINGADVTQVIPNYVPMVTEAYEIYTPGFSVCRVIL